VPKRIKRSDYYIFATQRGEKTNTWRWQILRKRKPLGTRLSERGFKLRQAAETAGKVALEELLNRMALDPSEP